MSAPQIGRSYRRGEPCVVGVQRRRVLAARVGRGCAAAVLFLTVGSALTACTGGGKNSAGPAASCEMPAGAAFTEYVGTANRPPWATQWHAEMLSAAATVDSGDGAASDDDLSDLAIACAGLTQLVWNGHPGLDGHVQDVVVGVQHYLYQVANADTEYGRFIVALVIKRTDERSAAFAVHAMPSLTDFSPVAPGGANIVQSLRSAGMLT